MQVQLWGARSTSLQGLPELCSDAGQDSKDGVRKGIIRVALRGKMCVSGAASSSVTMTKLHTMAVTCMVESQCAPT